MALYMMFYVVPDSHLDFLENHGDCLISYLEGEKIVKKQSLFSKLFTGDNPIIVPSDWPTKKLNEYSSEINHRQVELLHYILNGNKELTENVGCLFQTWFKPRHKCAAIVIDGDNFAFKSSDIQELKNLINGLTPEIIDKRLSELIESSSSMEDIENTDDVIDVFYEIKKACDNAISNSCGVLWTAC